MTLSRPTAAPWRRGVQNGGIYEKPRGKEAWGLGAGGLSRVTLHALAIHTHGVYAHAWCAHTVVGSWVSSPRVLICNLR